MKVESQIATPSMGKICTSQRIADELEELIAIGEIKQGKRLDEQSLAARFQASRTPVREALNQLEALGILQRKGGCGHYLAEVEAEELAQMFEAMAELECMCASLAARRVSWRQRAEFEQMQQACLEAAEKDDRRAFIACNDKLHALIYEAMQNQYLGRIVTGFRRKIAQFRSVRLKTKEQLLCTAQAHRRIIDLIIKARTKDDFQALRDHIDESCRTLVGPAATTV